MKRLQFLVMIVLSAVLVGSFPSQHAAATVPGVNTWVSLDSSGTAGNNTSYRASASGDGRYVSFTSDANNLVSGDTNGIRDIFVRDTVNNTTVLVSQSSGGTIGNIDSDNSKISYDGRYVVFDSSATNLVSGDTNGRLDVFIRDLQNNTTVLVSASSTGVIGDSHSANPDMTADGRFIVFNSGSTNFSSISTVATEIYLKDMLTGSINKLTVSTGGTSGANSGSTTGKPSISCDGGVVAFESTAYNLVANDTNDIYSDIFLNTLGPTGVNTITKVTAGGNNSSGSAKVSCNGNIIGFQSTATNLVSGDANGVGDIFSFNRLNQQKKLISVSSSGTQGNTSSGPFASISGEGRYITYSSGATNLVSGDTNSRTDVFVYDDLNQTTQVISINSSGTLGDFDSSVPAISPDGKYIVYQSASKNLVTGDSNLVTDIYKSQTGF